jgi:hypothetical protein
VKRNPRLLAVVALIALAVTSPAKKIYRLYNAAGNVMLDEPWDFNRVPQGTQDRVVEWMGDKK